MVHGMYEQLINSVQRRLVKFTPSVNEYNTVVDKTIAVWEGLAETGSYEHRTKNCPMCTRFKLNIDINCISSEECNRCPIYTLYKGCNEVMEFLYWADSFEADQRMKYAGEVVSWLHSHYNEIVEEIKRLEEVNDGKTG